MTTVLLRLEGPLQSWGVDSRFDIRTTRPEPTKSGVIGLVAAALGRCREDDVSDLAALRFGVRTDRAGSIVRDYHTAQRIISAKGEVAKGKGRSVLSTRYYLADASFLAGLEGGRRIVEEIHEALARPAVSLTLGRRSCPPSLPVFLKGGLINQPLAEALRSWPVLQGEQGRRPDRLRIALECDLADAAHVQADQPIGRAFRDRTFIPRGVRVEYAPAPTAVDAL